MFIKSSSNFLPENRFENIKIGEVSGTRRSILFTCTPSRLRYKRKNLCLPLPFQQWAALAAGRTFTEITPLEKGTTCDCHRLHLLLMKPASVLLCLLLVVGWCESGSTQAPTSESDLARSTQAIVVTTPNWNAVEGRLQRYERATTHEKWRPVGAPIAIVVGKNGLGWGIGVIATDDSNVRATSDPVKKEGDGKSPAGVFALGAAFGYASQPLPGLTVPYLNLTPSIECIDDAGSKYYNHVVDRSAVAPDWNSSEHMSTAGESYRWGIIVDHNHTVPQRNASPPEPGSGSCIFLHIWQSHDQGTAGCTAMPQLDLKMLLTWLDPARNPLLVQLPEPTYERLGNRWMLPELINLPPH
jgi:L,D-peptidoglycan transpeptidase YkuD (ErfK/YbiS/YcfS/YnhG family)